MGYRIEYDTENQKYEVRTQEPNRFPWMVTGAFALFLLLTWTFWPQGADMIREMLIPGDNAQTIQAMQGMVDALRDGTSFSDAVAVFCREIIAGAQASH